MSTSDENRSPKSSPGGGENRDLFGAEFLGSPCHHRVLKPPGGGTSDIFGGSEPTIEKPIVRKKSSQASSIVLDDNGGGCNAPKATPIENGHSKQDAPLTKSSQPVTNGNATNSEVKNGGSNGPRQRVPPGGFSSGLW